MLKRILIILALILGILLILRPVGTPPQPTPTATPAPKRTVQIGSVTVHAEVADTPEAMRVGLGKYTSLPAEDGMLFIYPSARPLVFWMKGMSFPIDIIWIKGGRVSQVSENLPPEPGVPDTELKKYLPNDPVDTVLEVNAGFVQTNGIKVGDTVAY